MASRDAIQLLTKNAGYLSPKTMATLTELGIVGADKKQISLLILEKKVSLDLLKEILGKEKTYKLYLPERLRGALYFGQGRDEESLITMSFYGEDIADKKNTCNTIMFQNDPKNKELIERFVAALYKNTK